MFLRLAFALLLALGAGGCSSLYFRTLNGGDTAVVRHSVDYLPAHGIGLDVYAPRGAGARPVVVFFYGGRWQDGTRADYAFVGEHLARAGVVAMLPDYRLYPAARFPDFMADAAAAVAWARDNAARFGGDPQRLFLAGHSAGAHMVALLGTDARHLAAHGLAPRDLRGVIGIAGPYDFLPLTADDLIAIFGSDPAQQALSQPVNFVDGDEPPFLLLHGESDLLVWNLNSARLKARFDAIGGRAEHRAYPGVGHIRILASLRFPALAPARAHLLDFVRRESAAAAASAATP
jgi:acetyl esterase/lipase